MLGKLLALSPAVLGVIAALGGGVAAGAGFWLYDTFVDDPYIRKTEQDACTIRTMDAANRAEKAERDRQAASVRAAQQAYNAALAAQETARRASEAQKEQEISNYERTLELAGRSCPLSVDDLNWLREQ